MSKIDNLDIINKGERDVNGLINSNIDVRILHIYSHIYIFKEIVYGFKIKRVYIMFMFMCLNMFMILLFLFFDGNMILLFKC